MSTGENEQSLRAVIDLFRKASVVILVLHFLVSCYAAFKEWHLTHPLVERVLLNIASTGLFANSYLSKLIALGLLIVSLMGTRGKKDIKAKPSSIVFYIIFGVAFYWGGIVWFYFNISVTATAVTYIATTSLGYLSILSAGARLSRLIKVKMRDDIFNQENETFPQEERLLENPYSVNLPAKYRYKGKVRQMWINLINGARMCLVLGSPGAGKTYFIIRHIIKQKIERRQFPGMLLYDFKYDDLAKIAYNSWLKAKHLYKVVPRFFIINFDEPINRCNPLEPSSMRDITDATESSRTILLGLNFQWIQKTGDFFVESPINFVTAIIWFLRKYKDGKYCTLPHVIELMQMEYDDLFPVLGTEPEIEVLIGQRPSI
jgi:hypothetical protein